ncbi:hypothetical protein JXR93_10420 [bacterium]|nr:hypothetical protein [bacterium]
MQKIFRGDSDKSSPFFVDGKVATTEKKNDLSLKFEKIPTKQEQEKSEYLDKKKDDIAQELKEKIEKNIQKEQKEYLFFKESFAEIEKIKKEAHDKGYQEGLQKGKKDGETQGYKEGFQKGEKEGLQKYENSLQKLFSSLKELSILKEKLRDDAILDALELSFLIAEKAIYTELTLSPKVWNKIIIEALKKMVFKKKIEIHLSHKDYNIASKEIENNYQTEEFLIISTDSLKEGEIKIVTDVEYLEFSISEALKKISDKMKDDLEKN